MTVEDKKEHSKKDSFVPLHNGHFSAKRAWFWRLSFMVAIICVCSQFQVYHIAVVSNLFTVARPWMLEQYHNDNKTVNVHWSVMSSALLFGQFSGTLMSGYIADRFGRKGAYAGVSILLTLSGLMIGLCKVLELFILVTIGRFLLGLSVGIAINVAVLLITEAAPKDSRGAFSAATQWFYSLGDLLAVTVSLPYVLGTEKLWPLSMAIGCLPAPFLLPVLFFIPESPRYLFLNKGKEEKCREAIRFYQGEDRIEETEKDLQAERQAIESEPQVGLISLFKNRLHRRSVFLASFVIGSCQLTGLAAIIAYSTMIIEIAGFDHNSASLATFAIGVVKLLSGFIPTFLMDTWGRRPMNQIGLIGCCLCHIALILSLWLLPPSKIHAIGVTAVLAIYLAAYTCQSCAACAYSGELFVQSARATGLMVANSCGWLIATFVSVIFLPMVTGFGVSIALIPFAIGSAVAALIGHFVLIETKGLTFKEIAVENGKSKRKAWATQHA